MIAVVYCCTAASEKELQEKEVKLMELQEFYETQLLQHKVPRSSSSFVSSFSLFNSPIRLLFSVCPLKYCYPASSIHVFFRAICCKTCYSIVGFTGLMCDLNYFYIDLSASYIPLLPSHFIIITGRGH